MNSFRRLVRRAVALTAVGTLAGLLALLAALPAAAHTTLTGSDPADGSTMTTAPSAVTLTFDEPVQNYQPVVAVTGPNGNLFSVGAPEVTGNQVSSAMAAGPAGTYTVAYRVVSADGHPVTGSITFTLAEQAAGTAQGTPATEAGAASGSSSGLGLWLWIGIGVAAVLVIAAVVVFLRKPGVDDA